jgi:hypothetical protein
LYQAGIGYQVVFTLYSYRIWLLEVDFVCGWRHAEADAKRDAKADLAKAFPLGARIVYGAGEDIRDGARLFLEATTFNCI